jgi:hypothetical protein
MNTRHRIHSDGLMQAGLFSLILVFFFIVDHTSAAEPVTADETDLIQINIEGTRPELTVGMGLGISAEITNHLELLIVMDDIIRDMLSDGYDGFVVILRETEVEPDSDSLGTRNGKPFTLRQLRFGWFHAGQVSRSRCLASGCWFITRRQIRPELLQKALLTQLLNV